MGCGKSKEAVATPNRVNVAEQQKPRIICVLGGPGAGKGTQCDKLVAEFQFTHVSTGDLLRDEKQKGGELADKLNALMNEGQMVSSDIMCQCIQKKLSDDGWQGNYLLDGFPRNTENWDVWQKVIGDKAQIDLLLNFDAPKEVLEERLLGRAKTSGRSDDNPQTIKQRITTFFDQTIPVLKIFEPKPIYQQIDVSSTDVNAIYVNVRAAVVEKGFSVPTAPAAQIKLKGVPQVVFVLGGPGAGKGTQCAKIVDQFQFSHISTGDLLRAEQSKGGQLAETIKKCIVQGQMISSEIMVKLVEKQFAEDGWKGQYLLDGFPRNQENWDVWQQIILDKVNIDALLYFEAPQEALEARLLGRGQTSGREDDKPETIKQRITTFFAQTVPVVQSFESKPIYKRIDATSTDINQIYQDVRVALIDRGFQPVEAATSPGSQPHVVFVLGGPGAGKGTQCDKIKLDFTVTHLSTGDLLRQESKKGGSLGTQINQIMKEGQFVSSEILVKLVYKQLAEDGWKGNYLLDGFPRNMENWDVWQKQMQDLVDVKLLLFFDAPKEALEKRLTGRAASSGRADDNPETIQKRIDAFYNESLPVIKLFQSNPIYAKIDVSGTDVNAIYTNVKNVMVKQGFKANK